MFRNTILALTAAAAVALAFAPAAQAKTNINIGVDLGLGFAGGGVFVGSPGYYYDDYGYADDCHYVKVKHKKWNKAHTKKIVFFTKQLVCY